MRTLIFEFDGISLSDSGYYLFLINIGANDVFTALFKSDFEFSVSPKNAFELLSRQYPP